MSGTSGMSPVESYLTYSTNEAKYANADAKGNAQETNLIAYFQKNAGKITSPAALLGNYQALSVVLGAFNMSSSINQTALLKKLMTEDPTSKTSTAQKLASAKFLSFAHAMSSWKPPPFSSNAGIAAVVTAFKTNTFEAGAGQQTLGMQNALYFKRMAGGITKITQLQSDSQLLEVAVVSNGLPIDAYDNLSFQEQTTWLTKNVPIANLQKPSYVQHQAELYLVQQQLNNPVTAQPTPAAGSMLSLFEGSGNNSGTKGIMNILESSLGTTSSLLGTTTSNSSLLSLFA
jgi:hypothetical protein